MIDFSLENTRLRLESAVDRILIYIDGNLEEWATEEVVIPCQQLAWGEGLSENAVGAIKIEKTDFLKCRLVWDLFGPNGEPLSIFLEEGTKEHPIEAKGKVGGGADSLMWYDKGGKPVFRKKVKHPGTRGKKIISRGWETGRRNLQNRIIKEANKFLQRDNLGGLVAE